MRERALILFILTLLKKFLLKDTEASQPNSVYKILKDDQKPKSAVSPFNVQIASITIDSLSFLTGHDSDFLKCNYMLVDESDRDQVLKAKQICREPVNFGRLKKMNGYQFLYGENDETDVVQFYESISVATAGPITTFELSFKSHSVGEVAKYSASYESFFNPAPCYIARASDTDYKYKCRAKTESFACSCLEGKILDYERRSMIRLVIMDAEHRVMKNAYFELPDPFKIKFLSITSNVVVISTGHAAFDRMCAFLVTVPGQGIDSGISKEQPCATEVTFDHLQEATNYTLYYAERSELRSDQLYSSCNFSTAGNIIDFQVIIYYVNGKENIKYRAKYFSGYNPLLCFIAKGSEISKKYPCSAIEDNYECSCTNGTITSLGSAGKKVKIAILDANNEALARVMPIIVSSTFDISYQSITSDSAVITTGNQADLKCAYIIVNDVAGTSDSKEGPCTAPVVLDNLLPASRYTFYYAEKIDTEVKQYYESIYFETAGTIADFKVRIGYLYQRIMVDYTASFEGGKNPVLCFFASAANTTKKYTCQENHVCSCLKGVVTGVTNQDFVFVLLDAKNRTLMEYDFVFSKTFFIKYESITHDDIVVSTGYSLNEQSLCLFRVLTLEQLLFLETQQACAEPVRFAKLDEATDYVFQYGETAQTELDSYLFSTAGRIATFDVISEKMHGHTVIHYTATYAKDKPPLLCFIAEVGRVEVKFTCQKSLNKTCDCSGDVLELLDLTKPTRLAILDANDRLLQSAVIKIAPSLFAVHFVSITSASVAVSVTFAVSNKNCVFQVKQISPTDNNHNFTKVQPCEERLFFEKLTEATNYTLFFAEKSSFDQHQRFYDSANFSTAGRILSFKVTVKNTHGVEKVAYAAAFEHGLHPLTCFIAEPDDLSKKYSCHEHSLVCDCAIGQIINLEPDSSTKLALLNADNQVLLVNEPDRGVVTKLAVIGSVLALTAAGLFLWFVYFFRYKKDKLQKRRRDVISLM